MNRKLFGTTALIALGGFAGGAMAQSTGEPIKLGLGGYWRGAGGQLLTDSGKAGTNHHGQGFQQDSAIYISGNTTLDNGLNVGVMVQFRGEGANTATPAGTVQDTVKRSYVKFTGNFGEVRFGDYDDARLTMGQTAPSAGSLFGVNSPWFAFTNSPVGTNSTTLPIDTKRAQRIGYFSPRIMGFQLGATYAPDSHKGNLSPFNAHGAGAFPTDNDPGQNSQAYSIAANYDNKFGDFRIQAFAATSQTHQEAPRTGSNGVNSPRAYDGGLSIGYGPFAVGSTIEKITNTRSIAAGANGPNLNDRVFDVGALYTVGPFSTSVDWSRGYYGGFGALGGANITSLGTVAGVAGASGSVASNAVNDVYEIIFDYVLGPGISVGAALEYDSYRSGVATVPGAIASQNYHDVTLAVGTALTF
jgi:predicted porin